MARGPNIRVPNVAGGVRGGDVVGFARRVGADPVDVDVEFTADTSAIKRHGLRRRYVGGIVIGVSEPHASDIAVGTP